MSRWLMNVNSLLEKLDDRALTVAEERANAKEEEEIGTSGHGGASIDDILAKRGLAVDEEEEEDEAAEAETSKNEPAVVEEEPKETIDTFVPPEPDMTAAKPEADKDSAPQVQTTEKEKSDPTQEKSENVDESANENQKGEVDSKEAAKEKETEHNPKPTEKDAEDKKGNKATKEPPKKEATDLKAPPKPISKDAKKNPAPPQPAPASNSSSKTPPAPPPAKQQAPPPPKAPSPTAYASASSSSKQASGKSKKEKEWAAEAKEAQKEARTLRRHMVSLNSQLEAAELELQAQRKELEGAAERLEKDRKRVKEEKELAQKKYAQELASQKAQHEQSVKEQQTRFEEQQKDIKNKLEEVEDRRKQEGGDWNNEVVHVIEREQEMIKRATLLEDEKVVLLSQISTLQGQQAALGSRLESLTQASDNGMTREHEAEERLDSALTQHAYQIRQRQARETDLELQVQELHAALVIASNRMDSVSKYEANDSETSTPSSDNAFRARVEALQSDLETANAHLALERERSNAVHKQLREMAKESTQEASSVHAKQVHYERRIADMSLTISKLQASLRDAQKVPSGENSSNESSQSDEDGTANQIKLLSEEVLRLRDKVANHNSESLTTKSRLRAAIDRATKAEEGLATATTVNGTDEYDSMERAAPSSGNGLGRRRRPGAPPSGSIRTAMTQYVGQGERTEQIGKVVDAVDSFAGSTGKYLRRHPVARAGFIFYLILIHLWTFVLLFLHAHSFETENGDFGAHGIHAVMKQQDIIKPDSAVEIKMESAEVSP